MENGNDKYEAREYEKNTRIAIITNSQPIITNTNMQIVFFFNVCEQEFTLFENLQEINTRMLQNTANRPTNVLDCFRL